MRDLVFTIDTPGTEYIIDPVTLLAVAVDPGRMAKLAENRLHQESIPVQEQFEQESLSAFMLVTAGKADIGETILRRLLNHSKTTDPKQVVRSKLRLVQALQAQDRANEAIDEALSALTLVETSPSLKPLLHSVLHHLGKALLQAKRNPEAERSLELALRLRQEIGDGALIESTELAIRVARSEA